MDNRKTYRFGNGDSIIINDVALKNKIIDFIFNSYDLSKFRYNMLTNLQKLEFLKENEHYVTPNFNGYNYLLVFLMIGNTKYCVAIEKKKLSYHKNQIDISKINMYKLLINANSVIFNGTIFDTKLISINKKVNKTFNGETEVKNRLKYYMLINDCYYLMGNQFLDIEMKNKMTHLDNMVKTHFNSKDSNNFTFKINKFTSYDDLRNLIENIMPKCGIKTQGLIFYPKYSGINVIYIDKQQEKIEISSNSTLVKHDQIEATSCNLITNMINSLKSRNYSYEKNGKIKKLWLKSTDIPDVFDVFEKDSCDDKLGIAHIPNLKTSYLCRESLKKSSVECFECIYDNNFKKWIPLNLVN